MTRTEFVRNYAAKSELSDARAKLGMAGSGSDILIALPCACGDQECEGWAMLNPGDVLDHLRRNAPEKLRDAYLAAVAEQEAK